MSEVVVEVDGEKHTYRPERFVLCENCELGERVLPDETSEPCSNCGERSSLVTCSQHLTLRPKWLWDDADSIDEMIARTRHKAQVLEKLQEDGWTIEQAPRDGYARLSKPVETKQNSIGEGGPLFK